MVAPVNVLIPVSLTMPGPAAVAPVPISAAAFPCVLVRLNGPEMTPLIVSKLPAGATNRGVRSQRDRPTRHRRETSAPLQCAGIVQPKVVDRNVGKVRLTAPIDRDRFRGW